jgi:hypothetical protein
MGLTRVLVTTRVTLSHTFQVDGVGTDAAAAVNVTVKRLDGTAVTSGAATVGTVGDGIYTFELPESAVLDTYTVDWTGTFGGAAVTVRDYVEVVGGFLFGLAEARSMRPPLDATKYPYPMLAEKRIEVEQIAERIAGVAFVPRFERVVLSGRGRRELVVPRLMLRAIRAVRVDGTNWGALDVSGVSFTPSGVLTRLWGSVWPAGSGNIVLEYEHGLDMPAEEARTAGKVHLRSRLTLGDTAVPYRAVSFTFGPEGGVYRMSTPGKDRTGIPEVDAAYLGQQIDVGGFA